MEAAKERRLVAWWRESVANIRKGIWWVVIVPAGLWFLRGLAEDRFFHFINHYLDEHAADFLSGLRSFFAFKGSLALPIIGLAAVLLFLIVRAYFATKPGIVGTADLMLQELDIGDLEIKPDLSSYVVNVAAFARMEVASLDKPRTVSRFEIEMIGPDGTEYRAESEYELGNYHHKHDVSRRDNWGITSVESVREPMEDLAAKLRTPIQPYTHVARAWVRFEIKGVKAGDEPKNCRIKIFAIDPGGRRHEINTDTMQVKAIGDDHEFAIPV